MPRIAFSLLAANLLLVGCSKSPPPAGVPASELADLPGLRKTNSSVLRDELARIESETGTPRQLVSAPAIPDAENAAPVLVRIFSTKQMKLLEKDLPDHIPAGEFRFSPENAELAIAFRRQFDDWLPKGRAAMARPGCDFRVSFDLGLAAENSFIAPVVALARLEALVAAEELGANRPAGQTLRAAEAVAVILHYARVLDDSRLRQAKIEAMNLRQLARSIAAAIVVHANCDKPTLAALRKSFDAELLAWPAERDFWFSYRAIGLHAFEMVRDGRLLDILSDEEIAALTAEKKLEATGKAVFFGADKDEEVFLQLARRLIDESQQPLYRRGKLQIELLALVATGRDRQDYPLISGTILLPDAVELQAAFAKDRALCEAWAIALATALGEPTPAWKTNPLTGKEYPIAREENRAIVTVSIDADDTRQVIVPLAK